jgi:hypothetical protein
MTVQEDQELLREFRRLQIRQVEILELLVGPRVTPDEPPTSGPAAPPDNNDIDADRPLRVGDKVRILNPGGIRVRRDTVCTVIRIGIRVTSLTPKGIKIVRAPQNLERVKDNVGTGRS